MLQAYATATCDAVTYVDHTTLLGDFQTLLSTPDLCDGSLLINSTTRLAFPSSLLSARSDYFKTLLSDPWRTLTPTLTDPSITPSVAQDLLEFLTTGAVTLSPSSSTTAIRHNLSLANLARYTLCDSLESIVAEHINKILTPSSLHHYLHPQTLIHTPPSPAIQRILITFTAINATKLCAIPKPPWPQARVIWRMFVNASAAGLLPSNQASSAARFVLQYPRLGAQLAREPSLEKEALLSLFLNLPVPDFATLVEPTGILPLHMVLNKYRREAEGSDVIIPKSPRCKGRDNKVGKRKGKTLRLLCESTHPHPEGARLRTHVQKVRLPAAGAFSNALLTFDARSALGDGAELGFYLEDPRTGASAHTFLMGSRLVGSLVLPATEFWYAFHSIEREDGVEDGRTRICRWGWRFFVEAVARRIDEID